MDVGAYSSQNLISPYLTGAQAQKDEPKGLGRPETDDHTTIPTAKETDKHLLPGTPDPTKVNSLNSTDDTQEAQAKAAEEQEIREMKTRDSEVRSHEAAHKAVGGQYAGAISFEYKSGPDGHQYAVGGEVGIDMSSESTPEATISKMQRVRAAALAPADPSAQDRSVAAAASAKSTAAARQMHSEQKAENEKTRETTGLQSGALSIGKNGHAGDYQKNERIIDAPAPTGQKSNITGFQDTGSLKAGAHKEFTTTA